MSDHQTLNFGDYLSELIVEELGCEFVSQPRALREGRLDDYHECLFSCGSILHASHTDLALKRIVVWGSGCWDDSMSPELIASLDIRAVRGPLTQKTLGLRPDIPLGDPGILVSLLFPCEIKPPPTGVVYVPHLINRTEGLRRKTPAFGSGPGFGVRRTLRDMRTLRMTWKDVDTIADIVVKRDDWKPLLQQIAGAEFVMTNSLHGAIISQSFGVPWALCLPAKAHFDRLFKWQDWYAYLGLDTNVVPCSSLRQAKNWWHRTGQHGKMRDRKPLLQAFPYAIANPSVSLLLQQDHL